MSTTFFIEASAVLSTSGTDTVVSAGIDVRLAAILRCATGVECALDSTKETLRSRICQRSSKGDPSSILFFSSVCMISLSSYA